MPGEWVDMTEAQRFEAYKDLLSKVEEKYRPSDNPVCPSCGLYIDWVSFPGTCSLKAKVVKGEADWKTTEVVDWDPACGSESLFCYNCGEDIHTLIKEY